MGLDSKEQGLVVRKAEGILHLNMNFFSSGFCRDPNDLVFP